MSDAIDISDLPVPGAAPDISDLPAPPKEAAPQENPLRGTILDPGSLYDAGSVIASAASSAGDSLTNLIAKAVGMDPAVMKKHLFGDGKPSDLLTPNAKAAEQSIAQSAPVQAVAGAVNKADTALGNVSPTTQYVTHEALGDLGDIANLSGVMGGVKGAAESTLADAVKTQSGLIDKAVAERTRQSLNAPRDAILDEAREHGLIVPPTAVNPTAAATAAESVSGKAATRQAMQAQNSDGFNAIIRDDLGLSKDQPLTRDALEAEIKDAGKSYGAVEKSGTITANDDYNARLDRILQVGPDIEGAFPGIGAQANEKVTQLVQSLRQPQFDAKDALGAFKFLNSSAKDNFIAGFAGDPQALQLARAQRSAADAMSDLLQDHLDSTGNTDLADQWRSDRVRIAKNYTALGALKGNDIDAINLAAQMRKDKPLSGGFKLVANFADQFPEVSSIPKSGAGVSKLGAVMAESGAGAAVLGHPGVAATIAAGTGLPYGVRKYLLSDAGQARLATPSYDQRLLDLADKYSPRPLPDAGPRAAPEQPAFTLSDPTAPPRAAPDGGIPLADVLSGNLSLGDHQPLGLTASAPTYAADPHPNFAASEADRLSQGLSLAGDHGSPLSAANPMDYARVISSQVPEGIMARTPNTASKLAELQHRYGLTLEEQRAPELAEQHARSILDSQAGFAAGGYLRILRHGLR